MVTLQPTWLTHAFSELIAGVREIPGPETNSRIAKYLSTVGQPSDDAIPWCAAFANWVMEQELIIGTGKPNARSFLAWGEPCEYRLGAICVLARGDPKGWQGHVGFAVGVEPGRVFLCGGNQGDAVSIAAYKVSRLLGYRWPLGD